MHKKDRPVIYIHPVTGDYKVPMKAEVDMPLRYKMLGYERKEFDSYFDHQRWMRSKGLICHKTEDISVDKDALGTNKWGY